MVINNHINALAEQPLMFLIITLIFGVYEYYTFDLYFIETSVIATREWYSTQKQQVGSLVFI